MSKDGPAVEQRQDGSLWLKIDSESPLSTAVSEIEVTHERQRWAAAPQFSRNRFQAKPMQKRIGLLRALIILVRAKLRPRDELAERLLDIEQLILGGHNEAADAQIDRLRDDYPNADTRARVLGLASLNLYDQGKVDRALYIHEFALLCETAHPAMIEIYGDTIRAAGDD